MSDRFFTRDPLGPGEFVLTGPEAHHLATVRRFVPGDHVILFNGDGNDYSAEVVAVAKKAVALTVHSVVPGVCELPFSLTIASALPKRDRADFLIEKLTELGVTRFVPLITARSVVIPKESVVEKFARSVIEACKQCGRNRLMVVEQPCRWSVFLNRGEWPGERWVLHPSRPHSLLPGVGTSGVVVAVGPEGGFTSEELDEAIRHGWQVAGLGPRVLRIETAAMAAAAVIGLSNPASRAG